MGGPSLKKGAAVWPAGQLQSHNAILFDRAQPAWNLVARPAKGDKGLLVAFQRPSTKGKFRFVAFAGFAGSAGMTNEMEIEMVCLVGNQYQGKQKETLKIKAGSSPAPLKLFTAKIDTSKVGTPGPHPLAIYFLIKGGDKDPKFAPALFGVRLLPEKAMNKSNWVWLDRAFPNQQPVILAGLQNNSFGRAWPCQPTRLQVAQFLGTQNAGVLR